MKNRFLPPTKATDELSSYSFYKPLLSAPDCPPPVRYAGFYHTPPTSMHSHKQGTLPKTGLHQHLLISSPYIKTTGGTFKQ